MATQRPRILVVHRDNALGEALAQTIGLYLNTENAATVRCDDTRKLKSTIGDWQPDTIVLSSFGCDYIAVLKRIRVLAPQRPILVSGMDSSRDEVVAAIRAGANACATIDESLKGLLSCLEALSLGQTVCPPSVAGILVDEVATSNRKTPRQLEQHFPHLTPREKQVIELVELGLSNKQIADRLTIEIQTVKNHVHNILEKLHLRRRAEAAHYARENGLLTTQPGTSTRI